MPCLKGFETVYKSFMFLPALTLDECYNRPKVPKFRHIQNLIFKKYINFTSNFKKKKEHCIIKSDSFWKYY